MGRYANWDDVTDRYTVIASKGSASDVDNTYIAMAEAELESRLGKVFSVPFDSDNLVAKDITIDIAFLKASVARDKTYDKIKTSVDQRIKDLLLGKSVMVTTSGTAISSNLVPGSNTGQYHPVFGVQPQEQAFADEDRVESDLNDRGIY